MLLPAPHTVIWPHGSSGLSHLALLEKKKNLAFCLLLLMLFFSVWQETFAARSLARSKCSWTHLWKWTMILNKSASVVLRTTLGSYPNYQAFTKNIHLRQTIKQYIKHKEAAVWLIYGAEPIQRRACGYFTRSNTLLPCHYETRKF